MLVAQTLLIAYMDSMDAVNQIHYPTDNTPESQLDITFQLIFLKYGNDTRSLCSKFSTINRHRSVIIKICTTDCLEGIYSSTFRTTAYYTAYFFPPVFYPTGHKTYFVDLIKVH